MSEFRFIPIDSRDGFEEALNYVAEKVGDLSLAVCGERLPVPILKLFAHNDDEYEKLEGFVRQYGQKAEVSSKMSFYVDVGTGLTVAQTPISLLGVRRPDPNSPQVGCGDYEVVDFPAFAARVQSEHPDNARAVQNAHGLGMVELRHPDFDVLGYIIPVRE